MQIKVCTPPPLRYLPSRPLDNINRRTEPLTVLPSFFMVMVPRQMAETLRPQLGERKLYSMLNLCFSRYFLYSLYIDGYNLHNTENIINSAYPKQ